MSYTNVAVVASASNPTRRHEVKTDGQRLTCGCPGWTRRVHFDTCPQMSRDVPCTCDHRADVGGNRVHRTCRHTREVMTLLAGAGLTIAQAASMLRRGLDLDLSPAVAPAAPSPPAVVAERWFEDLNVGVRTLIQSNGGGRRLSLLAALDEAVRRLTAGATTTVTVPRQSRPDWLGGGRAILLRD